MNVTCDCGKCPECVRPQGDASFGTGNIPIFPGDIQPRRRKMNWEDELYRSGGDI